MQAWKPIVEAVHAKGAKFMMQIWHVGRASHPREPPPAAGPLCTGRQGCLHSSAGASARTQVQLARTGMLGAALTRPLRPPPPARACPRPALSRLPAERGAAHLRLLPAYQGRQPGLLAQVHAGPCWGLLRLAGLARHTHLAAPSRRPPPPRARLLQPPPPCCRCLLSSTSSTPDGGLPGAAHAGGRGAARHCGPVPVRRVRGQCWRAVRGRWQHAATSCQTACGVHPAHPALPCPRLPTCSVAARNAIAAGFDGVEIHGANGCELRHHPVHSARRRLHWRRWLGRAGCAGVRAVVTQTLILRPCCPPPLQT